MATSTDPVSPDCSSSCLKEVADEVHFQDFCGLVTEFQWLSIYLYIISDNYVIKIMTSR